MERFLLLTKTAVKKREAIAVSRIFMLRNLNLN